MIFGGLLVNVFQCGNCFDSVGHFVRGLIYTGSYWVFMWKGSEFIVGWLDRFVPWIKYPLKRTLFSVGGLIVYSILAAYFLDRSMDVLVLGYTFEEASQRLSVGVLELMMINFGANLIMHGRAFLLEWRQASIDIERLKTEQVFTHYQSLKNQVNPHFLFNSLNALTSLVYEDKEKAVEFIRKLSLVYRYVLDKKDEEVVPVSDEIQFLENFVFLQKIRFGENLQFNLSGENLDGYLPPLALQLLVENAIKHNVVSDLHPLKVRVNLDESYCEVWNSKKEKLGKDSTGIGLENLRARYSFLTDREIAINSDPTFFSIKIPVLKLEGNNKFLSSKNQL